MQIKKRPSRVWIERVEPRVDNGRHPITRTVGEWVEVKAHIFTDGHDRLKASIRYKPSSRSTWLESPLEAIGNDEWVGRFRIEESDVYEYGAQAWIDRFANFQDSIAKKFEASQDIHLELWELEEFLLSFKRKVPKREQAWFLDGVGILRDSKQLQSAVNFALSERLGAIVGKYGPRAELTKFHQVLKVWVEPEAARFSSWYEMFPRSAGKDPSRSATFAEAAERLTDIARMGFDILYLPPIHPIGETFRKGPNNSTECSSGDPGSPWAIGSSEGGHKSVEPGLGSLEDFKTFVGQAEKVGLQVALDIAFQCSPDHPYVKEHPEWFKERPDGSIHYAENPPKKYQDIYPFNFESENWKELWQELLDVILFWVDCGVTVFRVDNPHTKPFAFWEWLIAEVHRKHPEVIFLSEAFTRPKVKYCLAKLGFTQSYTYFTWRNTKAELQSYVQELTQTPVREYCRPNFFANTPDILHEYLQHGGRHAFEIRLVLAATLSSNYGIYSGFELCENQAVRPGSEEYLDSEKYQIKPRDWNAEGNIKELVRKINSLRKAETALQYTNNITFCEIDCDDLIAYTKVAEGSALVVVVNLDPHNWHEATLTLPLWQFSLDEQSTYRVRDLLTDNVFTWQGARNYIRLNPSETPAHIFAIDRGTL